MTYDYWSYTLQKCKNPQLDLVEKMLEPRKRLANVVTCDGVIRVVKRSLQSGIFMLFTFLELVEGKLPFGGNPSMSDWFPFFACNCLAP